MIPPGIWIVIHWPKSELGLVRNAWLGNFAELGGLLYAWIT